MRDKYLLFGLLAGFFITQGSIYETSVETPDGATLNMSLFLNRKILVTTIKAENPDSAQLRKLDSLQRADSSVTIIAVPTNEFGGSGTNSFISEVISSINPAFIITKIAMVRKSAGSDQHPLFVWLTHVQENSHFDVDVTAIGQTFLVSRSGNLFGVLDAEYDPMLLSEMLNQEGE